MNEIRPDQPPVSDFKHKYFKNIITNNNLWHNSIKVTTKYANTRVHYDNVNKQSWKNTFVINFNFISRLISQSWIRKMFIQGDCHKVPYNLSSKCFSFFFLFKVHSLERRKKQKMRMEKFPCEWKLRKMRLRFFFWVNDGGIKEGIFLLQQFVAGLLKDWVLGIFYRFIISCFYLKLLND